MSEPKCPFSGSAGKRMSKGPSNADWWPEQLNLKVLHQHSPRSSPMGALFDYGEAFKTLDLDAVIKDLHALMTDSQEWWPADYGHYGPFFVRMGLACRRYLPNPRWARRRGHRRTALRAAQ